MQPSSRANPRHHPRCHESIAHAEGDQPCVPRRAKRLPGQATWESSVERLQYYGEGLADLFNCASSVDDADSAGLGSRQFEVGLAHALEELRRLFLEAIRRRGAGAF